MNRHRHLAIVVSTPPERADFEFASKLALAARNRAVDVSIFVMSDAVAGLVHHQPVIARLDDQGCELCACAHSAHERGLGEHDVGMVLGSQDDHAAIVGRADRLGALT